MFSRPWCFELLCCKQRIEYDPESTTEIRIPFYCILEIHPEIDSLKNLRVLSLEYNILTRLPDSIGNLKNLKILNLNRNFINELPETIGNLHSLERLDLGVNSLTRLPESIGSLENLRILYLYSNMIQLLPASIGNLSNLNELWIYNNKLECLPESFGRMKELRKFIAHSNKLLSLPENFCDLENIRNLNISENSLKFLPSDFGNLKSLERLSLRHNSLIELPESFGNLKNLLEVDLAYNILITLPDSFCGLERLKSIHLQKNNLHSLPETFGSLSMLSSLNIEENALTVLPDSISDLVNLKLLVSDHNELVELPASMGNMKSLVEVHLQHNKITRLPDSIGKLKNLKILRLDFNHLVNVPASLGNLESIEELYLNDNRISTVPATFENLNDLILLNIQNNRLFKSTKSMLNEIFDERVILENSNRSSKRLCVQEALANMRCHRVYWNISVLKTLKSCEVLDSGLSEFHMIDILGNQMKNEFIGRRTHDSLVFYVKMLYHPEIRGSNWSISGEQVMKARILLGNILKILRNEQWKGFGLDIIAEAIENYCSVRQIGELKAVYTVLSGNVDSESCLDIFIRNFIAAYKEKTFNQVVLSSDRDGDVHVLNFWKNDLRHILGFEYGVSDLTATIMIKLMRQGAFRGSRGNVLNSFFRDFTAKKIIKALTEELNTKNAMMCELMQEINSDDIPEDRRLEMGLDDEFLMFERVNEKAVEYILLKKNILLERKPGLNRDMNLISKIQSIFLRTFWCCE